MNLQSIRERINIFLYDSRDRAEIVLNYGSLIVSIVAIGFLVYYHGFDLEPQAEKLATNVIRFSFAYYIFKYIAGFVYSFQPLEYLQKSWFEGTLMLLVAVNFISYVGFDFPLVKQIGESIGIANLAAFYTLFIQVYFLFIIGIELGRISGLLGKISLTPPMLLLVSFLLLISIGTGLLSLPEMSASGQSIPLLTALFTSISASCVTGLIVVDTATFFSVKGQLIIMFLIQMGGLNIISFATLIAMFSRKGIGIKHQSIIQENLSTDSLLSSRGLLRQIFLFSFGIELIGTIILYFLWSPQIDFANTGEQIFFSLFHSISAFNNAGFSLFTNGLYEEFVNNAYLLQIVIAALIFFGGLGFPAMREVFGLSQMRARANMPWKTYSINTKIALYVSIILVLVAAVFFFLLERNYILSDQNIGESIITSIFQSVTARTAGFNTVDIGMLRESTLILFIFFMFIGASSGSTGGGIKTSTFALIFSSAWSTIRGKKHVEMFKHTVSSETLNRAYSIFLFSATFIFGSTLLLSITENQPVLSLVFEEVSAFATVGLSTGITGDLSNAGKIIIMINMFVGRIGTLTLAFALSKSRHSTDYKYPKASFLVG